MRASDRKCGPVGLVFVVSSTRAPCYFLDPCAVRLYLDCFADVIFGIKCEGPFRDRLRLFRYNVSSRLSFPLDGGEVRLFFVLEMSAKF